MSLLQSYIVLNFILALAALLSMGFGKMIKTLNKSASSVQILLMNYVALFFSAASFLIIFLFPEGDIKSPLPQTFSSNIIGLKTTLETNIINIQPASQMNTDFMNLNFLLYIIGAVIFYRLIQLILDIRKTLNSFKGGFLYKKIGRVSIYLSSEYTVPYAFSLFRKSFVSVPEALVENPKNFKIILMHELQHIRNKDTRFALFGEFLKAVFFFNPFLIKWVELINLEQEFSCDEVLISKRGVSSQDYKNCLFEVVNLERGGRVNLVGATRFIFGHSRSELSRRIRIMSKTKKEINKVTMALFLVTSFTLMSVSAYAMKIHGSLGELSVGEVKALVKKDDFSKSFQIDINKDVVKWVNKYARTKKGTKYTRKALSNYFGYKDAVDKHIKDYGHPKELAAIPFVESMYQNLDQSKNAHNAGAGVWQFIPSTARAYNLRVSKGLDERLDVFKETDAAMRYLGALNLRFQDWRLALLSYNAGEGAVQSVVNKTGSRDVWKIVKSGIRYDKGYVAKVMAAAIIMKYPEIVR